MKCLNPVLVVNPRYRKDSYRPQIVNASYPSDYWLYVPCGTCFACNKKRASDWRTRLVHEAQFGDHRTSNWITLTIAPKYYAQFKDNPSKAIRLFLERLRQEVGHSIRHWFITELGEDNDRLHFHGFVFDIPCTYELFRKLWKYGFVYISNVSYKRIGYACKYAQKISTTTSWFRPQVFCSAGLGRCYCLKYANFHISNLIQNDRHNVIVGSCMCSLPRYYNEHIFGKERLAAYRSYLESHPPEFIACFGKMRFSDVLEARAYRDQFYLETRQVGSSRSPWFYAVNNSSIKFNLSF